MAGMDITPELAQRVLRGGPDAIAVVRGIYQTQIQKLDDIETKARQIQEAAEMLPLRWIPVSERRPEVGQEILCFFEGEMYLGRYVDWPNWNDCTHWMPLPEPPECP
jgi:hypothetical protein